MTKRPANGAVYARLRTEILLRASSGRRSVPQILAMDWLGDAVSYVSVASPYGLPAEDVVE